jgi:hypothetical protein
VSPEFPLKPEQVPVELPVYDEQPAVLETHPAFPLNKHPFKNVSQSESAVIPVA